MADGVSSRGPIKTAGCKGTVKELRGISFSGEYCIVLLAPHDTSTVMDKMRIRIRFSLNTQLEYRFQLLPSWTDLTSLPQGVPKLFGL